ncbi:MAG: Gfo/Idh/MocA family protein [Dyella sp.]|uniref:Gfo/Idh/MocA family protein n=1 Tax=Dyella sp. TaxID=1869338 RepID=UPI003F7F1945
MKPIKIIVIGPGLIGKQHIRLVNENPRSALTAIVAPDHAQNHVIAAELDVPLFYDLSECLAHDLADAAILSSPNEFHAAQGITCIEAAVPVLIEKPITASVADGERLLELATARGARVLVGHHRAHSPLMSKAREAIGAGRLGRLVSIMGSAQFHKPARYFKDGPWRREVGGGPILINLIHEIGNFRSLCGEIAAVQAVTSSATRGFPVEDTVAINFIFANGALGTFLLSDTAGTAMSWEQTSGENPSYPSYPQEDCYTIAGTRGSLSVPTMRLRYYPEDVEPSWWTPFSEEVLHVERRDPLACQLEHFLDLAEGKAEPLVSAEDGLRNLRVTEAIRKSARDRQLVNL